MRVCVILRYACIKTEKVSAKCRSSLLEAFFIASLAYLLKRNALKIDFFVALDCQLLRVLMHGIICKKFSTNKGVHLLIASVLKSMICIKLHNWLNRRLKKCTLINYF